MKPISHDATIAMIMSVSPNLNSSSPISGVVAEADAISHTMNICGRRLYPLVIGYRGHAHRLDLAAHSPADGRGALLFIPFGV